MQSLKPSKKPDEWVIPFDEHGVPIERLVSAHAIAILHLRHAPPLGVNSNIMVEPEAIRKFGPVVFEFLENVVKEVQWSMRPATVIITWDDQGYPSLQVKERGIIASLN